MKPDAGDHVREYLAFKKSKYTIRMRKSAEATGDSNFGCKHEKTPICGLVVDCPTHDECVSTQSARMMLNSNPEGNSRPEGGKKRKDKENQRESNLNLNLNDFTVCNSIGHQEFDKKWLQE
ncbi:uncharacterized protein LOC129749922 [Uranotaenia lowii]|uniref:uncharacterized protein LOC129749922 n=1 Tax=Uranotaenia lowii TaxID=190385 RepID=UPI00247971ED|nr:uncharacterized protein LOC129749922 [Uranotaenia lowii]